MAFVLDDMVFWPSINDLSEGAALDLVAVLASGELIVVGLVFAGNESSGKPMQGKISINLSNFIIYWNLFAKMANHYLCIFEVSDHKMDVLSH